MKSFSIQIPNDKATTYNVVTFIIAIINLLAFGFAALNMHQGSPGILIVIGFISSLLPIISLLFKKYVGKLLAVRVEILFILSAVIWLFTGNYLLGVLLFAFAFFGFVTLQPKLIQFSEAGIRYPSFPVQLLSWKDVDFVILKDDILTIEMKNNKLMQFTLEKDISSAINPGEFNDFCRELLAD